MNRLFGVLILLSLVGAEIFGLAQWIGWSDMEPSVYASAAPTSTVNERR